MTDLNTLLTAIANKHLSVATLETQHSDGLDFHDCAVWALKAALEDAYAAGQAVKSTYTVTRDGDAIGRYDNPAAAEAHVVWLTSTIKGSAAAIISDSVASTFTPPF